MKLEEIVKEMGELTGESTTQVISFVGAGGKTTCMLELARSLAKQGKKVLVTTTTHMEHPVRIGEIGCVDASGAEILEELEKRGWVIAGSKAKHPEKITGLPASVWEQVRAHTDCILVEADGAKRFPVKVPGAKEPVIPEECTHIFLVAGASALGRPLEEICFRLKKAEAILQKQEKFNFSGNLGKQTMTEQLLGILLEKGYVEPLRTEFPKAKLAVIFNQADILPCAEKSKNNLQKMLTVPVFLHGWKKEVHGIYLAAGFSRRFGGNKLLTLLEDKPMYLHLLERLKKLQQEKKLQSLTVVTQYEEILDALQKQGIQAVKNEQSILGISSSLKLGLKTAFYTWQQNCKSRATEHYYMFFVADQPFLKKKTIEEFLAAFLRTQKGIGCVAHEGKYGNPVIFHEKYVPELLELDGDQGGKRVLNRHLEDVFGFEVEEKKELTDIDRR